MQSQCSLGLTLFFSLSFLTLSLSFSQCDYNTCICLHAVWNNPFVYSNALSKMIGIQMFETVWTVSCAYNQFCVIWGSPLKGSQRKDIKLHACKHTYRQKNFSIIYDLSSPNWNAVGYFHRSNQWIDIGYRYMGGNNHQ